MIFGLMIIYDFDFVRVSVFPDKTDAPLVVDADAVPSLPVALEGFESVARRHPHVIQLLRCRELRELAKGHPLNIGWKPARAFALPNFLRLFASEILNHSLML